MSIESGAVQIYDSILLTEQKMIFAGHPDFGSKDPHRAFLSE